MSTQTAEYVQTHDELGNPVYAHIVPPEPPKDGATLVMEARINGTPVTALCGFTWVPSRDAQKYPLCPKCKAICDELFDEGWEVND